MSNKLTHYCNDFLNHFSKILRAFLLCNILNKHNSYPFLVKKKAILPSNLISCFMGVHAIKGGMYTYINHILFTQ